MTKLVINKCFGGFGLSKKAIARLAELQGKTAYFFDGHGISGGYSPISVDAEKGLFFSAFSIPNPNEYFADKKDWCEMSQEERIAKNAKHEAVNLDSRPNDRADPLLVQVVEELGKVANGAYAKLEIVEIPDGIEWHLDEYDGIESVHENHRSW